MAKTLYYILLFTCFVGFSSFYTTIDQTTYTRQQIENFIKEVFADQADALVFKSASSRFELIENFLHRFKIINQPDFTEKHYPLLSSLALVNKYNPKLSRDVLVNPNTFNPLKYHFPMSSTKKEIFRVDHTDYLIVIAPAK